MKLSDREKIVALLETFEDARDPAKSGSSEWIPGELGDRLLLMNAMWSQGSYGELEQVLRMMRDGAAPILYWNVAETYLRAVRVRRTRCKRCGEETTSRHRHQDKKGNRKRLVDTVPSTIKVVSKAVRPELVDEGVVWIVGEFRRRNIRPRLPGPLYKRLTGQSEKEPGRSIPLEQGEVAA